MVEMNIVTYDDGGYHIAQIKEDKRVGSFEFKDLINHCRRYQSSHLIRKGKQPIWIFGDKTTLSNSISNFFKARNIPVRIT